MHALLLTWMLAKPVQMAVAENARVTVIVSSSHLYLKTATAPFWYRFDLPFVIERVGIDANPSDPTAFRINDTPAEFHEPDGTLTIKDRNYSGTRPSYSAEVTNTRVDKNDWSLREHDGVVEIVHRNQADQAEMRYTLKVAKR